MVDEFFFLFFVELFQLNKFVGLKVRNQVRPTVIPKKMVDESEICKAMNSVKTLNTFNFVYLS